MALFDNTHEVTIIVSAKRTESVGTGKVIAEQRNFTVTDFYTEAELLELISRITPEP